MDLIGYLPTIRMGGFDAVLRVPAPTISATAPDALLNQMAGTAPMATLSATGFSGIAGTFNRPVPMQVLVAGSAPEVITSLPMVTISASFLTGAIGSLDRTLPALTPSAIMLPGRVLSGSMSIPMVAISAAGFAQSLGTFSHAIRAPVLVATGLTGNVGTLDESLPMVTFDSVGHGAYTLTASRTLPAMTLEAEMTSGIVAAYRTWVLNTRKKGLTEYDGFTFNSYAVFRGMLLGANSSGLFKHNGEDADAGSPIVAVVRTGKDTFGTSMNKRVPRIYVGYECRGPIHFSTITTQGGKRTYLLAGNNVPEIQQRRVPIGRGPKSPYWQFEVTNPDGTDFLLDNVQPMPEKSYRRIV